MTEVVGAVRLYVTADPELGLIYVRVPGGQTAPPTTIPLSVVQANNLVDVLTRAMHVVESGVGAV